MFGCLNYITYSIGHIVIGSSIHIGAGPLEETLLSNTVILSMSRVVELVLCFTQVGVIKLRPCLTLAHF